MIIKNFKNYYIAYHLLKKILKQTQKIQLTTWSRESCILPIFIDQIISVHNGKKHFPIRITKSFFTQNEKFLRKLHKFGEFNNSRFFKSHKVIDRRIKKKKK